jgi:murein DD-endopeptidase MepM/ murein hydrolase activator NlpD
LKNLSVNAKTTLYGDSSLLSRSEALPLAVRRWMALVGFSISIGSAGALLLHSNQREMTVAEVPVSSETLTSVLAQNSDRKYELARSAIATGELDQAVAVVPEPAVDSGVPEQKESATPTATLVSNLSGVIIHEVKQDETLWQLTQMYRVDAASIAASNNISSATELQVGMKLVIPPVDGLVHRVRKGETLDTIAAFYKVPKAEILKYSPTASGDFLAIDQPLIIPGNVTNLLQIKSANAKRELFAERERLRARLAKLEGKTVPTTADPLAQRIVKPAKATFTYTVRSGDTVEMIARRHGVTQEAIVALNKLENAHWIQVNQELLIPAVNPKPADKPRTLVAHGDTGRKVNISSPLPPAPWSGLAVLAGNNPVIKVDPSQPTPVTAGQPIALNPSLPSSPLQQLTEQLPAVGTPSPVPSGLIAPEPTVAPPAVKPEIPSTTLAEQESRPNAPVVAVAPTPAQELPDPATPDIVAVAIPVPELPLSQLADQVETSLARSVTVSALVPEAESRMASQEVRQLEREVEQLSLKLREAEERKRQEAMRLAAATLNPAPAPTTVPPETPVNRPSNSAPQLPNLTAKAYLPEVRDYGISAGFIWPTNGVLTSGYGPRWGRIHRGIDIAGPVGTPIVAAASGRVSYSGWNDGGYGYLVEIVHPDGSMTRYAHNSALYVKVGEQVNQGQLIAAMGSTGYSTGPHLHFEIHPNGNGAVDPMPYLARR